MSQTFPPPVLTGSGSTGSLAHLSPVARAPRGEAHHSGMCGGGKGGRGAAPLRAFGPAFSPRYFRQDERSECLSGGAPFVMPLAAQEPAHEP